MTTDAGSTTCYVTNTLNQYTADGVYYQYDTSGNMTYDGHYVFDYDPENRLNKVKRFEQGPTAMALACDTTLTFTFGGSANWFTQTQEHYFEGDAAQSGDIADSQQSWMQATVSGTGYISFYWKVSSDGGDYLRFYIDDQLKEEHAGVAGWNQSTKYYVSTGGSHTLKWVYIKNSTGSGGSDCAWVDKVLWEVPVPVGVDKGVDSLLAYTSGGNNTWAYVTSGCYGGDSAKSGQISDSNETWMETEVEGAGTFKFWWKVSSESGADYLEFYIGAQLQDSISGTGGDWAEKSYNLGTGSHTLKWRYVKDDSGDAGEDCGWVDHVQWSAPIAEPATDAWSTLTYTYDPSGRRIEKKYDDTLVLRYIYDGDHCIAEYDDSNNLRRKYIFGPCVDEPVCMIEGSTTNYYHFDALGSIVALTDESGDTTQVYEYSIYGQVGAADPDHSNRFTFTGREFDKETGLYYYRARYYNAEIGRFLQIDPICYGDGMNLYRYCHNNPLTLIDPFGLDAAPLVIPPYEDYRTADDAALAASNFIWAIREGTDIGTLLKFEYFYLIYSYKNPGWKKSNDPCLLFGFTPPIPVPKDADEAHWDAIVKFLQEYVVPSKGLVVAAGHDHGRRGDPQADQANAHFSLADAAFLLKMMGRWSPYAESRRPFTFYLLTPQNRVRSLSGWWDDPTRDDGYDIGLPKTFAADGKMLETGKGPERWTPSPSPDP